MELHLRSVVFCLILAATTASSAFASVFLDYYTAQKQSNSAYFPSIFTDENMADAPSYRLRAKFIDGSQYGFHAATSLNNNGAHLDALPNIGTYSVVFYWIKYNDDGTVREVGSETAATVWVTQYGIPAYDPNWWNANSTIRLNNNCYNYANNKRTDTIAQPGRYGGDIWTNCGASNGGDYANYMQSNSMPVDGFSYSAGSVRILLVGRSNSSTPSNWDFHFYRQDKNGQWSHKPGQTNAKNTDDSGVVITNPWSCNRGSYTVTIMDYMTISDVVQGSGHATIQ